MLPLAEAAAARLALAVLDVHAHHLHVEQLFHRPADVVLSGHPAHLEGVGVAAARLVHPLLGHQRPEDDLVRLQLQGGSCVASRAMIGSVLRHESPRPMVAALRTTLSSSSRGTRPTPKWSSATASDAARSRRSIPPPAAPTRRPGCGGSYTRSRRGPARPPARCAARASGPSRWRPSRGSSAASNESCRSASLRCRRSATPRPSAWRSAAPSSASGTTNRAGWRAWMCPPPRRIPLRIEPARALPVPFCRYIFFVVPDTSARLLVFAEP